MKKTKWALQDIRYENYFLAKSCGCSRHGVDVVTLDDERLLLLFTREIARDYAKGIEGNFRPVKVTLTINN